MAPGPVRRSGTSAIVPGSLAATVMGASLPGWSADAAQPRPRTRGGRVADTEPLGTWRVDPHATGAFASGAGATTGTPTADETPTWGFRGPDDFDQPLN